MVANLNAAHTIPQCRVAMEAFVYGWHIPVQQQPKPCSLLVHGKPTLPFPQQYACQHGLGSKDFGISVDYCNRNKNKKIVHKGILNSCTELVINQSLEGWMDGPGKMLDFTSSFASNFKGVTGERTVTKNRSHQHVDGKIIYLRLFHFYVPSLHIYNVFI